MKKLKLFLFSLILFSGISHALTLTQLQTEIRLRVKDTSTSRQRYSDTQLTNLVNEAQRDVVNNTWPIEQQLTFTTSINTTYYALPSNFLAVERFTANNVPIPETSFTQLDEVTNGSWISTTGKIQSYFLDRTQGIGIYPIPATSSDTVNVVWYLYVQADDLTDATKTPFDQRIQLIPYHDLIIFYAAYRIYTIEGELDKAKYYRDEYENRLALMKAKILLKPNFNPSFSGPNNSR